MFPKGKSLKARLPCLARRRIFNIKITVVLPKVKHRFFNLEVKKLYLDILTEGKVPKYNLMPIPKKNGGNRIISIPDETTLNIQKEILTALKKSKLPIWYCATAYKKGSSILQNAKAHIGNKYMIHYDLRDFFDTITPEKLKAALQRRKAPKYFIKFILKWCMYHGTLPQGAPTSPFLSNLVCTNLDRRFFKLAKKLGATYTRYADDITISGDKNILEFQSVFKRIIRTEKFFINHLKTRITVLDSKETRNDFPDANFFVPFHIVTGLAVYKDKVFVRPFYWKKIGNALHSEKFLSDANFKNHIVGKLSFASFIACGDGGRLYQMYKDGELK